MKRIVLYILIILSLLPLTSCKGTVDSKSVILPKPEADSDSMFGVDKTVNMSTIDNYLSRDDVVYIDVRMLFDPAQFGDIGGDADLSRTISGFRVVPYPFIATLQQLPVEGAYNGNCLYEVIWNNSGQIESIKANYAESDIILSELFPQDKAIFLMCGGGGYSAMMKSLLIYLGWQEDMIYNVGGNWNYTGANTLELVIYPEDANDPKIYATWRADYTYIEFSRLQRING
ncbi:MAG: hypothetical protein FWG21_05405 [Oscillospiraceae bacterium]|nr:hypothetical protein [Oscillospiraceae bacterium]